MRLSASLRTTLAVLAVTLGSLSLLPAPPASAAMPGVNSDLTWGLSPWARQREVLDMKLAGVTWVRLTLRGTDSVEPRRRGWNWGNLRMLTTAIRAARRGGFNVLMLVSRSPRWASGSTNVQAPPRRPRDYAKLVHFLARRWGSSVQAYEIWNEENQTRWWPARGGANAVRHRRGCCERHIRRSSPPIGTPSWCSVASRTTTTFSPGRMPTASRGTST